MMVPGWRAESTLSHPGRGAGCVEFDGFFLRSLLRTARRGRVEINCSETYIERF